MPRIHCRFIFSRWLLAVIQTTAARPSAAAGCSVSDVFETDRPDVTNSPLAVPRGSLQAEDGVTLTGEQRSDVLDGAETMLRVGAADCTELALQLPSYFFAMNGEASSGFSDVAVAFKRQLPDLYGFVTAAAAGLILPGGSTAVSDGGYDPYIQGSWSRDIADGWSAAGMFTLTWLQSNLSINLRNWTRSYALGRIVRGVRRRLSKPSAPVSGNRRRRGLALQATAGRRRALRLRAQQRLAEPLFSVSILVPARPLF
jgi:outer membrane putative beta-barrel porin/alpha-amylase